MRRYLIYDVFTDRALAGNPLAVVLDCEGLDGEGMQRIAREFNLSETVFVAAPKNPAHAAAIRIFTPHHEMPFAGHPTVGTAVVLADEGGMAGETALVLEEEIGAVRCAVSRGGNGIAFAAFDLPRLPAQLPFDADTGAIAAALGLEPQDIGFGNHRPDCWSAGVAYVTVPVAGLGAAAKARLVPALWRKFAPLKENGYPASAYLYCSESADSDFHARMFNGGAASYEDPATGSAAAAFAGAVNRFDALPDGAHRLWIEQGVEMGRPSRIRLEMDVAQGGITAARIGGHAVRVAEGALLV